MSNGKGDGNRTRDVRRFVRNWDTTFGGHGYIDDDNVAHLEIGGEVMGPTVRIYGPCLRRATPGAVGYDLQATADYELHVGESRTFPTGVHLEIPSGMEAQVRGRSGLSRKGIVAMFGTIDQDYRGDIGVTLINISQTAYTVRAGDRIAQLVFAPVVIPNLQHVGDVHDLESTDRGAGGHGSTGR